MKAKELEVEKKSWLGKLGEILAPVLKIFGPDEEPSIDSHMSLASAIEENDNIPSEAKEELKKTYRKCSKGYNDAQEQGSKNPFEHIDVNGKVSQNGNNSRFRKTSSKGREMVD